MWSIIGVLIIVFLGYLYKIVIINGLFYKKNSIKRFFSELIYNLKWKYKFKLDDKTYDGSGYLLGIYKDYFISIYLYKKDINFKIWYKIVSFGFYGRNDELNKRVFLREILYEPNLKKKYNNISEYIISMIRFDIERFQDY